jgi:hypothetical protein
MAELLIHDTPRKLRRAMEAAAVVPATVAMA